MLKLSFCGGFVFVYPKNVNVINYKLFDFMWNSKYMSRIICEANIAFLDLVHFVWDIFVYEKSTSVRHISPTRNLAKRPNFKRKC